MTKQDSSEIEATVQRMADEIQRRFPGGRDETLKKPSIIRDSISYHIPDPLGGNGVLLSFTNIDVDLSVYFSLGALKPVNVEEDYDNPALAIEGWPLPVKWVRPWDMEAYILHQRGQVWGQHSMACFHFSFVGSMRDVEQILDLISWTYDLSRKQNNFQGDHK